MLDVTGKTVMISGAGQGLGAAFARQLSADGWNVSVGARRSDVARRALEDVPDAFVHHYEALEPETTDGWLGATVERFGGVDALINNAGIFDGAPIEELSEASLNQLWGVNVMGPFRLIKAALPHLRASGTGRVVNVSSLSGLRVKGPFAPGYALSKYAVTALTEAVKNAGWDDGVRVTSLHPGFVNTDMVAELDYPSDDMIQPEDLAELVATILRLPNTAQVARLAVSCELEPAV